VKKPSTSSKEAVSQCNSLGELKLGTGDVPQQCWGRVASSQSAHLLCLSVAGICLVSRAQKSCSLALSAIPVWGSRGFFLWLRAPSCYEEGIICERNPGELDMEES